MMRCLIVVCFYPLSLAAVDGLSYSLDLDLGYARFDFPDDRLRAFIVEGNDFNHLYAEARPRLNYIHGDYELNFSGYLSQIKNEDSFVDENNSFVEQLYFLFNQDSYELIAGFYNASAGYAKSVNVVDVFSENTINTIYFANVYDEREHRLGELAIGGNYFFWNDTSLETYYIPELSGLSDRNNDQSRLWLRVTKPVLDATQLEVYGVIKDAWQVGMTLNTTISKNSIFYLESLVGKNSALLIPNSDLQSFNPERGNTNINSVVGYQYDFSEDFSVTAEYVYNSANYSQRDIDSVYQVLANPTAAIFSDVINNTSDPNILRSKYYLEFNWYSKILDTRFILGLDYAEDDSSQISFRTNRKFTRDYSVGIRGTLNNGRNESAYGSFGLGYQIGAYLEIKL